MEVVKVIDPESIENDGSSRSLERAVIWLCSFLPDPEEGYLEKIDNGFGAEVAQVWKEAAVRMIRTESANLDGVEE